MHRSLVLLILMGQCSFFTCQHYVYHFIEECKSWSDAQKHCKDKYTDLATVFDMTDVSRLLESAKGQVTDAWIGLNKTTRQGEREWSWSLPGVEFNTNQTRWKSGEPNRKTENCVRMVDHEWQDISCTYHNKFICYDENNQSNKFHFIEERKTWPEAQSYCRENHTDLVSGEDQLQDDKLKGKIDSSTDKTWLIGLFADAWRWSDESSFFFRHWDENQMVVDENQLGDKGCATAMLNNQGRWKNDSCDSLKSFICYEDKVILIKEKKTWEEAVNYCRENYNDLASITNLGQQKWVEKKANNASTSHVWLGLRYTCILEFWFWVSDERVSYKNWASDGKVEDCDMSGAMETGGEHKWFARSDEEKFHFICSEY